MDAGGRFNKALLLLDRGREQEAETILRDVIDETRDRDQITNVRAKCVLGELLFFQERNEEAESLLKAVATVDRDDDVLAYECARAAELLSQLGGPK